jgi:hypothetical protein
MAQEPDKVTADPPSEGQPAATGAPHSVTSAEIRSQIEHTRAEMTQTIDAIQARLSPSRMLSDAKQTVKDATVGRVRSLATGSNGFGNGIGGFSDTERVIRTVKRNPIPVALAGVAATLLVARAVARSRHRADDNPQRAEELHTEQLRVHANGYRRRLVAGVCAGLACWTAWRAQQSRLPRRDHHQTLPEPASSQSEPGVPRC